MHNRSISARPPWRAVNAEMSRFRRRLRVNVLLFDLSRIPEACHHILHLHRRLLRQFRHDKHDHEVDYHADRSDAPEPVFGLVRTGSYELEVDTIGDRKSIPENIPRIAPSSVAFFQNSPALMPGKQGMKPQAHPPQQESQPRQEALRFQGSQARRCYTVMRFVV